MTTSIAASVAIEHLEAIREMLGKPAINSVTANTLESLSPDDTNKPRLRSALRQFV